MAGGLHWPSAFLMERCADAHDVVKQKKWVSGPTRDSRRTQLGSRPPHGVSACPAPFCRTPMVEVRGEPLDNPGYPQHFTERIVRCCPTCGWWVLRKDVHGTDKRWRVCFHDLLWRAREPDRALTTPLNYATPDEIRAYLAAKYESRTDLDPSVCEQVVASVYRDLGYLNVRVTGGPGDGGIDIIMEGPGDTLIGVQVKRSENKIGVSLIREFTGSFGTKRASLMASS